MEIRINYEELEKTIEEQLNEQGLTLGERKDYINELHKLVGMCWFYELITYREYDAAIKRLHKKVMENVKPLNEEESK